MDQHISSRKYISQGLQSDTKVKLDGCGRLRVTSPASWCHSAACRSKARSRSAAGSRVCCASPTPARETGRLHERLPVTWKEWKGAENLLWERLQFEFETKQKSGRTFLLFLNASLWPATRNISFRCLHAFWQEMQPVHAKFFFTNKNFNVEKTSSQQKSWHVGKNKSKLLELLLR